MTDYERDVLRSMSGEHVEGLCWGAAMSEAVEALYERGLVDRARGGGVIKYFPTDAGKAALK